MPASEPPPGLARWLAQGVTSRTHFVLRHALETFFHPLGIEADFLEAEPFGALELGQGEWWLRRPRWNPGRFDPQHPAAPDFGPILAAPDRFRISVDPHGLLFIGLSAAGDQDAAARQFLIGSEQGWRAARHALPATQAAEAFLYAAAGLLLTRDPLAALYAQGDDAAFCAEVRRRLGGS